MGETVTSRRWSAVGLTGGVSVLLVVGWLRVPWTDRPGGLLAVPAQSLFTPDQLARAEDYAAPARAAGLVSLTVALGVLIALAWLPASRRAVAALSRRAPWWAVVPLVVTAVRAVVWVATLPSGLWGRHLRLEYGLTTQGISGWLVDRLLGELTTVVIDSLVVGVLLGVARLLPRLWPVVAGLALAGLVFVGSFVYPVVVEPLFNSFTPMADGPLRSQILALADKEAVEVDDVLVADASRRTTTLNAYVSGFGSTRRVVLYDTLLEGVPPEEVLAVVAHELAHARHQDVLTGTALGAAAAFAGSCLLGLVGGGLVSRRSGNREATTRVPTLLALLAVATIVAAPAANAASRAIELRADLDALRATDDPTAFVELQRSLALRSLADPTPPKLLYWWFASHPTVLERVALAETDRRTVGSLVAAAGDADRELRLQGVAGRGERTLDVLAEDEDEGDDDRRDRGDEQAVLHG